MKRKGQGVVKFLTRGFSNAGGYFYAFFVIPTSCKWHGHSKREFNNGGGVFSFPFVYKFFIMAAAHVGKAKLYRA